MFGNDLSALRSYGKWRDLYIYSIEVMELMNVFLHLVITYLY